ncbi:MAG: putative 2OG-Fe(II) oxygenase [Pseudomonadota bacterium]
MRWLETQATEAIPPAAKLALLQKAIDARPGDARAYAQLGEALLLLHRHQPAIEAFEAAAARDPAGFAGWPLLAVCYLRTGRPAEALAACERGHGRPGAQLHIQRGLALRALRRFDEARAAFEAANALGDPSLGALKALLHPLAVKADGGPLLAYCDALDSRYRDTALVRAHRALALSRLGRTDEAGELVDLERHVRRVPLDSPFAGFNRALAEEIARNPAPEAPPSEGFDITYSPQTHARPALSALLAMVRDAIGAYVEDGAGLASLPPPPEAATLYSASVILRRDGANGEHVHARGYVSTVYHVLVPEAVTRAGDDRGALALGACEHYTRGYRPCWGVRHIKPVAGWLTLFPSHVFHDVVPSRSDDPRISVSADLRPVRR